MELEEVAKQQIKVATEYANRIVLEANGYPMIHTATDLRTIIVNAFLDGQRSE